MKRYVLWAFAGAAVYAAIKAVHNYPFFSEPGRLTRAVEAGINPTDPILYAAAAAGVVARWVTS